MKEIIIDTSSSNLILGLIEDDKYIDKYCVDCNRKQSDMALSKLKDFLEKNKMKMKDIEKLYVGVGPGSFTGIRVAIVIANTWKQLNEKLIVVPFNSLGLHYFGRPVVRDARSDMFYFAEFDKLQTNKVELAADKKPNDEDVNWEYFLENRNHLEEKAPVANYIKSPNAKKKLPFVEELKWIAEIEKKAFDDPWNYAQLFAMYQNPNYIFHVNEGAYMIIMKSDINDIIRIASAIPRKGYASKLLDNVEGRTLLEVRSRNTSAINFYAKNGFKSIGMRASYYKDDDAIIMERT